jgi:hypothetical protein
VALLVDSKLDEVIQFLGGCSSGIIDVHSRIEALQQELGVTRSDLLAIIGKEINQKHLALQKGHQESSAALLTSISELSALLKLVSDEAERSNSVRIGKLAKEISDANASIQSKAISASQKHEQSIQQTNSSLETVKSQQQKMLEKIIQRFDGIVKSIDALHQATQLQLESVRSTIKKCSWIIIILLVAIIVLQIVLIKR